MNLLHCILLILSEAGVIEYREDASGIQVPFFSGNERVVVTGAFDAMLSLDEYDKVLTCTVELMILWERAREAIYCHG